MIFNRKLADCLVTGKSSRRAGSGPQRRLAYRPTRGHRTRWCSTNRPTRSRWTQRCPPYCPAGQRAWQCSKNCPTGSRPRGCSTNCPTRTGRSWKSNSSSDPTVTTVVPVITSSLVWGSLRQTKSYSSISDRKKKIIHNCDFGCSSLKTLLCSQWQACWHLSTWHLIKVLWTSKDALLVYLWYWGWLLTMSKLSEECFMLNWTLEKRQTRRTWSVNQSRRFTRLKL